jgi:phosphonate transport system permease protein
MTNIDITLPSKKFKNKVTIFSITAIVVTVACIYLNFNPLVLITEFHYIRDLLGEMFPPNYETLTENTSTGYAILQTLSMAFLGTLYGGVIAIVLAFLAASNTMPYKTVRLVVQGVIALIRIMPTLVVVLIFVIAVGPGAFAGMLTLVFTIIGTFGKLFVDIIENAEDSPGDAIFSVGASRMQVIRYSVIPQILPSLIASLLYSFDVSMRTAISLGIFGGGGIGFKFQLAKSVLHYKDMTASVSIIIVLVVLTEKLSDYLRRRILGEGKLK